ncbi:Ribosomal biosis protein LAS1L [Hondaea fermentalgiana]|uniref:Ribosomal biosis protein LAS1L n=1 Tax=Hondaea fermentalgiana TaxID=2315210 RepID=A0A2R5GWP2_9STRA|nr:Ribosomal biosis protein LAS1L [Hondaea fermentalgiana]|eukprot:GBG33083.1 Ribosomal biosis protein LAS1L [Hondaea fermentalgiana]
MPGAVSAVRCAWRDWAEWTEVFGAIFGADGEDCPCVPRRGAADVAGGADERVRQWRGAADKLEEWVLRTGTDGVPPRVLATLEVLQAILLDHEGPSSTRQSRLAYAMAVVRGVNFVVDPLQKGQYAQSILELASKAELPRWLVDVRHTATHDNVLPSLEMLRLAIDALMQWLLENYWAAQARKIADARKGAAEIGRRTRQTLEKLSALIAEAGDDPDYDEIDETVDRIIVDVPGRFVETEVIPALCATLIDMDVRLDSKKTLDRFLLWERVLAGISDGTRNGFAGSLIAELCSAICTPGSSATKKQKECALRWATYLLSRRWHGLSDDSLAGVSEEGRCMMDVHPLRWSKTEMDDMLSPAPARVQDRVGLLPALRFAMLEADTWSQRLVGVLLPALVGEAFEAKEAAVIKAVSLLRLKFGKAAPALRHAANANPPLPSLEDLERAFLSSGKSDPFSDVHSKAAGNAGDSDAEEDGTLNESEETVRAREDAMLAQQDAERQADLDDILTRARKRLRAQ